MSYGIARWTSNTIYHSSIPSGTARPWRRGSRRQLAGVGEDGGGLSIWNGEKALLGVRWVRKGVAEMRVGSIRPKRRGVWWISLATGARQCWAKERKGRLQQGVVTRRSGWGRRGLATSRWPRVAKQLHGGVRGGVGRSTPTFRSTVAGFIPSFSIFLNYLQLLNRSQFLVKTKVPRNFDLYKTYLGTQSQFLVERDKFG